MAGKFISLGGISNSQIAVVAKTPDRIILFTIGTDGVLYQKYRENGTWLPSLTTNDSLGGTNLVGDPVAVSSGTERADVFALDKDGVINHKWYSQAINWVPGSGGINKVASSIKFGLGFSAIALDGIVHLFARGPDNSVYHQSSSNNTWTNPTWENIGGNIIGTAATVSHVAGRIDLFARKADKTVIHRWFGTAENKWFPAEWESMGALQTKEDPVAVSWGFNRLDVFVVGPDGKMQTKFFDGKWNPSQTGDWIKLAGGQYGKTGVVAWGGNKIDTFHHGSQGVWKKSLAGATWGEFALIPDSDKVDAALGPVVNPNGAVNSDVFFVGKDKALWTLTY